MSKIKSIKEISKPNIVYNLHIENNHNYIANDQIVSNCHTASSKSLKNLLSGPFANIPIRWGLSGTIPKEPFKFYPILTNLGPVVHELQAHQLQEEGVLASCNVDIIQLVDIMDFDNYHDENKFLVTDETRLEWISEFITEVSNSGNTMVIVNRIETGEFLHKLIPNSMFLQGSTKNKDRNTMFDDVNSGDNLTIIGTAQTIATGVNIPRIFNLVMFESGKSFIRVIQSIGRGIRKAKDKDFVQIYDLASTCKFSRGHMNKRKALYNEAKYPYKTTKIKYLLGEKFNFK